MLSADLRIRDVSANPPSAATAPAGAHGAHH
jgi:hypothetical protein